MTFPLMPIAGFSGGASGTTTVVGAGSFIVPIGVTSISVTLNGPGGGGGGGNTQFGGDGGAGARVVQSALPVTPGETLTITGGVGGTAGTNGALNNTVAGGNGTTLYLKRGGTTLMTADYGNGGNRATSGQGEDYPGADGAAGNSGTGGTVTTGGGSAGGNGGRSSPSVSPGAGSTGTTVFTWT